MNPKTAAKEEDIPGAIELWVEKSNRLARHGADYVLPAAYKKVALEKMLTGKVKEIFELWETDKLPFTELLKKTKNLARAKTDPVHEEHGRQEHDCGNSTAAPPASLRTQTLSLNKKKQS